MTRDLGSKYNKSNSIEYDIFQIEDVCVFLQKSGSKMSKKNISGKISTPSLLLFNTAILLAAGIFLIVNGKSILSLLRFLAAFFIVLNGVGRVAQAWNKPLRAIMIALSYLVVSSSLFIFSNFYTLSLGLLLGIAITVTGILRGLITLQCLFQHLGGFLRNLIATLISIGFGLSLLLQPALHMQEVFIVTGIYLILSAFSEFLDFFFELMKWDLVGNKVKRRVRIPLPAMIAAFLPVRLMERFNNYFRTDSSASGKLEVREENTPETLEENRTCCLEAFIHLSRDAVSILGHVDLCFEGTVYSYGCYDYHAHRFGGLVSDGTLAVVEREAYLNHCLTYEKKTLIGFGFALSVPQKEAVKKRIEEIQSLCKPWKSDYEQAQISGDQKALAACTDAASALVRETGGKIYKISSGPFRTYFAVNTNCVQLADSIIGRSGIDAVNVNGIPTPGEYYRLLNDLFERTHTIVVSRTVYAHRETAQENPA